jgi:hypothetical protein
VIRPVFTGPALVDPQYVRLVGTVFVAGKVSDGSARERRHLPPVPVHGVRSASALFDRVLGPGLRSAENDFGDLLGREVTGPIRDGAEDPITKNRRDLRGMCGNRISLDLVGSYAILTVRPNPADSSCWLMTIEPPRFKANFFEIENSPEILHSQSPLEREIRSCIQGQIPKRAGSAGVGRAGKLSPGRPLHICLDMDKAAMSCEPSAELRLAGTWAS